MASKQLIALTKEGKKYLKKKLGKKKTSAGNLEIAAYFLPALANEIANEIRNNHGGMEVIGHDPAQGAVYDTRGLP